MPPTPRRPEAPKPGTLEVGLPVSLMKGRKRRRGTIQYVTEEMVLVRLDDENVIVKTTPERLSLGWD